jgi:hypothetical protein
VNGATIRSYTAGITRGYLRLAKAVGVMLASLLVIAGLSFAVVTPFWFLATRYTVLYTIIALSGIAAAFLVPLSLRLYRSHAARKRLIHKSVRFIIFIALVGLLYILVFMYARGRFAIAVPLTVIHIAVTGLMLYGQHRQKK